MLASRSRLRSHGMQIAHLGVVAFIIGVTAVKAFEKEHDVALTRWTDQKAWRASM